jgi:hypothetical protein
MDTHLHVKNAAMPRILSGTSKTLKNSKPLIRNTKKKTTINTCNISGIDEGRARVTAATTP